jgi:hypothetical protein
MAELFQTFTPNVSIHIRNVFAEGELRESATVKDFLTVRQEGMPEGAAQWNVQWIRLDLRAAR